MKSFSLPSFSRLFTPLLPLFAATLTVLLGTVGCGRSDLGLDDYSLDGGAPGDAKADAKTDGGGKACRVVDDCDPTPDPCTVPICNSGHCQTKPLDRDGDGHSPIACHGDDCNDNDPSAHPGAQEICSNGADNDCNGIPDCSDPQCLGATSCVCGPFELCGNGFDDDCNGKSDCQDPGCATDPSCQCGSKEICGNNIDDDCNGKTDCVDPSCANSAACSCNRAEICDNGFDDNCDGRIDCDDQTCSTDKGCTCRQNFENCSDGQDNNCNGMIDCADPQCATSFECSCNGRPPQPETCGNRIDDDCNGKVDCADPACFASASCSQCTTEDCANGKDDNCNGLIDCADSACAFAPNCRPTPEICDNGIDDDHNGDIDCLDVACKNNPLCLTKHSNCLTAKEITASGTFTGDTTGFASESSGSCGGAAGEGDFYITLTQPSKVHLDTRGTGFDSVLYVRTGACQQGRELACDDDSGGDHAGLIDFPILYPGKYFVFVDGFTTGSGPYVLNVTITPNPPEICGNGTDDDGDHYVDCADSDCASVGACVNCNGGKPPTPEIGIAACTDGLDNDCDGKSDCTDSDCHASAYYTTECCNGKDDNGNGIVDDFSCRCVTNNDCSVGGQFCYVDTAFSCGDACFLSVGEICPYVAAGSLCSQSTQQCEFP